MANTRLARKGIVLLLTITTLLLVLILAYVLTRITTNQARLTQHRMARIQAYYAAMAGLNYAYDMLYQCSTWSGGFISRSPIAGSLLDDSSLPVFIKRIDIAVSSGQITSSVNYTFSENP